MLSWENGFLENLWSSRESSRQREDHTLEHERVGVAYGFTPHISKHYICSTQSIGVRSDALNFSISVSFWSDEYLFKWLNNILSLSPHTAMFQHQTLELWIISHMNWKSFPFFFFLLFLWLLHVGKSFINMHRLMMTKRWGVANTIQHACPVPTELERGLKWKM